MREDGDDQDYLIVARVRRPHGVRGELQIAIDTDRVRQVFRRGRVLHLADAAGEPVGRAVAVERFRLVKDGAILKLAGIESRDDVEGLRGHSLVIEAAEAAPAGEDEVHRRDLVGLRACHRDKEIGTVADVRDFPGGEMLLIRDPGGREILVPLVAAIVTEVDVQTGTVTLDLPDGLLDL